MIYSILARSNYEVSRLTPKINLKFVILACAIVGISFSKNVTAGDVLKLVEPCFACHGNNGVSTQADVPGIAGYSEDYFSYSLDMYSKKERPCIAAEYPAGSKIGMKTDMCEIVKNLSERDIELMAEFFSGQKFVRFPQSYDAELAVKGEAIHAEKCDECHSKAGSSPDDNAGFLGGQKMGYLREQITFVKEGKRFTSKKMRLRLENLDSKDIEALVHYYGSIK